MTQLIDDSLHLNSARALTGPVRALLYLTIAVAVVIPHSLQLPTAVLLAASAASALLVLRSGSAIGHLGICFVLSTLVTIGYVLVGVARGAPELAVYQTLAVYVVSPFFWMILWRTAFQFDPAERVVHRIILLAVPACLSVALFFFLFTVFGPGAVRFFVQESNVSFANGVAGATMHVYGSLIFLTAAIFAAPELIKRPWPRVALLAALAAVALTSGRAALVLAMPVGFAMGLFIRQLQPGARGGEVLRYLAYLAVGVSLLAGVITLFTEIDLGAIVTNTVTKVTSGGGEARTDQSAALLEGVSDTLGLGAGHGIGVAVVRNADYAWRYENVLLASLFRVGVLGSLVYAAAWVITLLLAGRLILERRFTPTDTFVLAGLVAMLIAAPTNPYLESFIFQWAYTLPLVYFSARPRAASVR